jgi:hypothetical protein
MAHTFKLEAGKKYLTRDGRVAEIKEFIAGTAYPFRGRVDGDSIDRGWLANGQWGYEPGERYDLVESAYRYFRCHADADRSDQHFIIWRNVPGERLVEGWFPNRQGDEWTDTSLSLTDDLLSDPYIIECDADGFILGRRELTEICTVKTTEDLTSAQRTRVAKLAARIVLADGPVLTVDELAGMTVGELVAQLGDTTIYSV